MADQKNKVAAKKAALLEKDKTKIVPVLVGVALIASVIAGVMLYLNSSKSPGTDFSTQSEQVANRITYPLSMFSDGRARHFQYKDGSTVIRYFVLKSSDGVIRAAFDACDVCWPSGKGYYQEGNEMVCKNCGQRFSSMLINEIRGGCNPEPLVRKVSGDNLVIYVEDILDGKKYFDF